MQGTVGKILPHDFLAEEAMSEMLSGSSLKEFIRFSSSPSPASF